MTIYSYLLIIIILLVAVGVLIFLVKRPKKKGDVLQDYTAALNYLIAGDTDAALKKLRETVDRDTSNIDAYLKIGDILRDQGAPARAVKIHRGLLVRRNLDFLQKIGILKSLIKDYRELKNYERAIQVADSLIELTHNEVWAQEIRLKLYEIAGRWDEAFESLKNMQKRQANKDKELLALYKVQSGLKDIENGEEREGRLKFREAIKLDKGCPPAYLYLSDSYIRQSRDNDALTELKKFIKEAPEQAYLAFGRIEDILFRIGNFGEVEHIFEELLEKNPKNEPIRFALIDIYERKGEIQQGIDLCYSALEINPASNHAKHYLAKLLPRIGQTEKALQYALDAVNTLCQDTDSQFECKNCGYQSKEPLWHCPSCHEWDTFVT